MANLKCLNSIISNRLAVHIDLTSQESWDLNPEYTSVSINEWKYAKSEDKDLLDFGLTAFDNGRVDNLGDSGSTSANDTKLTLYRVGNNNATGGTFYDNYSIAHITGTTVGNYFDLTGGYLNGFFKLQGEEYEVLPSRFGQGITIESLMKIDFRLETSIFYMMGARAEDKYNPFYSGETEPVITEEQYYIKTGYDGGAGEYIHETTGFTGRTTNEGNYYSAFIDTEVQKPAFPVFEEKTEIIPIEGEKNNVFDNTIAFIIKDDGRLGVKRITENGKIKINYSDNQLDLSTGGTGLGWHLINVTFIPYKLIEQEDEESLKCEPRRKGILTFYVDGRKFYEIKDYDEFMFKGFNNHKEKVYGVPYNISWGGGSFGLKHSYHYSGFTGTTITQDPVKSSLLIENNFNLPYTGGIQKLRVYDYGFNSQEALHNAYWESIGTPDMGIVVSKGGRLIYQ